MFLIYILHYSTRKLLEVVFVIFINVICCGFSTPSDRFEKLMYCVCRPAESEPLKAEDKEGKLKILHCFLKMIRNFFSSGEQKVFFCGQ